MRVTMHPGNEAPKSWLPNSTILLSAALFLGLGAAARHGATRNVNRAVRARVGPKENSNVTQLARTITFVGGPDAHLLFSVFLAMVIRMVRGRGGSGVVAASLSATAVDKLSRVVIRQRRPRGAGRHRGLDRFAYPSGHTCAITAIATAAVGELTTQSSTELRNTLDASAAILSLAVGWSRLYLDEHWIDDVAGGLCAGLAIGTSITEISKITHS